ncbi:hypothetical protein GJAV_G00191610 [Gymnothorax javanicus]|nr:hypothetical protein GJAV_G00191610 [Gymnothorax javanicus]
MQVLLALRGPLGPPDLRARRVSWDPKGRVVLKALQVPLVSQVLLAESDLLAPTVTLVLRVLLVRQVKMALKVYVETLAHLVVRETLDCVGLLELQERRESRARMDLQAQTAPQVLRDWLDSVVLWVCQDSVERGDSLAFQDLLVNQANRELQVGQVSVVPLALWDPQV